MKLDTVNIPQADKEDIVELQQRIEAFKSGKEDEEKFKLYRLTRGVYGQRQQGVQMFRIKIPYGKINADQLIASANVSEKYATGNLHLTTRQDIQLHYVKLKDTPDVWVGLTAAGLTGREACGNTVRNLTASVEAGIDPNEPFDITPYAHAVAYYFLRNPVSQEMGRKIKPAFSSSDKDTAYTYFHDFGFLPKINENGEKGFKVVVGGGLGAQSIEAPTAYEFLAADKIIPFMEAALRVFDKHGEREKRHKARMKFLVQKLGIDAYMALVQEQMKAVKHKSYPIDENCVTIAEPPVYFEPAETNISNREKYDLFIKTNIYQQKQQQYVGVFVKVLLGDLSADTARALAPIIKKYAADDVRITLNQGLMLRFVHPNHLPELFTALDAIGLAEPGFDSLADITACPGTDTCNLGVTNSTGLAKKLELLVKDEFPQYLKNKDIKIKISGCMNSCGQHMASNIGFHGSSIKKLDKVIPAMQIVLGGGFDKDGKPLIAERIIKLPTKRIPEAVRTILAHYETNKLEGEAFNEYYLRYGRKDYYDVLKHLAAIETLGTTDFFDWGQDHQYKQEIGVGECAGVILDVVGSILSGAYEKIDMAKKHFEKQEWAESIYYSYTSLVIAAKALLLSEDVKCNTQAGIVDDFQEHFIASEKINIGTTFPRYIFQINHHEPSETFATSYLKDAATFIEILLSYNKSKTDNTNDKEVVESYYKA